MKIEFEATFAKIDKDSLREKLKSVGAHLVYPEYLMKRVVFKKKELFERGCVRVRQESDKVTMNYKITTGKLITDQHEIELIVDSFENAVAFCETINLNKMANQETLREKWKLDGAEVTLDTWPGIPPFVEIESDNEEKVRAVSEKLGFDYSKAYFGQVGEIYEAELGIPKDIINNHTPEISFQNPPRKIG